MMRYFNPQGFLKSVPNALLREYFKRRGILPDFDWDGIGEYGTQPVFEALTELDDDKIREDILHQFREIHKLSGPGFTKAILAEASFHDIDPGLTEQFEGMKSHLARAFWTFLHRRDEYWTNTLILYRIDRIPKSQWHVYRNMPARPNEVDADVVQAWKRALIQHFMKTEGRGKKCEIRPIRIGDDEIFYAYPEDYKDTISEFVGERLEPRTVQPVFEVIVVQNDIDGTVKIYIEGDPTVAPKIKVLFAKAVLHADACEEDNDDEAVYALDQLLSPEFGFEWGEELDIIKVVIRKMRVLLLGKSWRRFTLEINHQDGPQAIYNFLTETTAGMKYSALKLEQVELRVDFSETRPGSASSKSVALTAPNKCRLALDERSSAVHQMLQASNIERCSSQD